MVEDVSDEVLVVDLGTVMNFEPSLFVYFAVALFGDVGDRAGGCDGC
jgi:hypothetical protein